MQALTARTPTWISTMQVHLVGAEKGSQELRHQGESSEREPAIARRCLLIDLDVQRRTRRGRPEGDAKLLNRTQR